MLFGLTGAHRSGKTSLARTVADELGIEFYETSISKTSKELGYNSVADLSLVDRLHLQTLLLENHIQEINKRARPLITDRTPLDFLGYLACEFTMNNGNNLDYEVLQQAAIFTDRCLETTKAYYDSVTYLCPLPGYEIADGKPADNPIYQTNHALTVLGAVCQLQETVNYAMVFETDWEVRRQFFHDHVVDRLDEIDEERKTAKYLH